MKPVSIFTFVVLTLALSGCVAQPSAKSSDEMSTVSTVKTGAAVTLSTTLPKMLEPNIYNFVGLSFSERYEEGDLTVRLEPSEGLTLFGGQFRQVFDMSVPGDHNWPIDVKAEDDGIYFLNIFAEAGGQARAFSVRLDIGEITPAMKKSAMPDNGEMQDGIRVMEAEETIR